MSSIIVTTSEDLKVIIEDCLKKAFEKSTPLTAQSQAIEIIDTAVLCQRLGITEPTAIRHRKRKTIPFLQIGTSIRYDWYAVVKALESKKAKV